MTVQVALRIAFGLLSGTQVVATRSGKAAPRFLSHLNFPLKACLLFFQIEKPCPVSHACSTVARPVRAAFACFYEVKLTRACAPVRAHNCGLQCLTSAERVLGAVTRAWHAGLLTVHVCMTSASSSNLPMCLDRTYRSKTAHRPRMRRTQEQ